MSRMTPDRKAKLLQDLKNHGVVDLTKDYDHLEDINLADKDSAQMIMFGPAHENYINSKAYEIKTEQKNKFKIFATEISKQLTEGEEKVFSLSNGQYLYFINKQYIISIQNNEGFCVFTNNFEPLFYFNPRFVQTNNYSNGFSFGSDDFEFEQPIGNRLPTFKLLGKRTTFVIEKNSIQTLFGVKSSLKKLSIKNNQYTATFANNLYSTITLNKDLDIFNVSISKALKKNLNCGLEINNINGFSEIHQKVNEKLKESLEVYTLLNDKEIKLKGSQEQFDQDMLLFKESIKHINEIKPLYNKYIEILKKIGSFYLNIEGQSEVRILDNIDILENYKKDGKNFINNEIFDELKKIDAFSNKVMKFTYNLDLNIKSVKKNKIATPK